MLTCALLQVVDDVLDFTGSALALGKPALNDLKSGLATAPVLFAAEVLPNHSPALTGRPCACVQQDEVPNISSHLPGRSIMKDITGWVACLHI